MKFEIGQKVKVIDSTFYVKNDSFANTAEQMIGNIYIIERCDWPGNPYGIRNGNAELRWFNESDLEAVPEEKTWETITVGDVLIDRDGYERDVLGVCGRVIFVSYTQDKDCFYEGFTKESLIKDGWTIKQDTPTEEVVEMTVEEATKKLVELLGKEVKIK